MNPNQLKPIGTCLDPLSAEDVVRLEDCLGLRIPDDYRDFLSRFGRCGFAGEASVVTDGSRFPIFTFYGGGTEAGSLLKQLELHPDLREIGVLPIADDLFNNIYVFDIEKGGISRLDYSSGGAVANHVAASFADLLGRIEVLPDEPL